MKNLNYYTLISMILLLFACKDEGNQHVETASKQPDQHVMKSSQMYNLQSITAPDLVKELEHRKDYNTFMNDLELLLQINIVGVENYALPDSTTKKLLRAARIQPNQTKSVFFNEGQIKTLLDEAKKDDSYNSVDTFGLSIYFGEYDATTIKEINKLHTSANLSADLIGSKTAILCPSILLKNNGKDSLVLLKAESELSSLNVGELCPTNCPKNGLYRKDGSVLR